MLPSRVSSWCYQYLPGTNTLAYLASSSATKKKKFYNIDTTLAKFVAKTSSMTFNSFVQLDFSCNGTSFGQLTEQSSGLTSKRTASQSSGSNFQWSN